MTTIIPNELDTLMNLDPLELSAQNIDKIIDYQRQARAHYEAGGKALKPTTDKMPKGDLAKSLGIGPKPVTLVRRV